ncbi:HNH endonuclease [Rhizobium laguerreae]|nr:HNH endonuclease [Rhizobium laguerreae]
MLAAILGGTNFTKCIFCRGDATQSRSIEHIVPESLGNFEHTLPPGIVCDRCNNYFARKIEGPLLETEYFRHLRSMMAVPNKRGRIPPMSGHISHSKIPINIWMDTTGIFVEPKDRSRASELERTLLAETQGTLLVPVPHKSQVDPHLMSRFIGKVAIEALALRVIQVEGWREELLTNEGIEPLRRFVRVGDRPKEWQFYRRNLYRFDRRFIEETDVFEVLHEYDFVYTEKRLLFFVMAIFGEEFAIDMGNPEILSYETYLREQDGVSPLYPVRHKK